MAFDGFTVAALTYEFAQALTGGKIARIAQPEPDEILLTVKNKGESRRLLISVNASLPFFYLTDTNIQSPVTAPSFCMVLRKHISNGRIISVSQLGLERILIIEIEHLNEMGDLCRKKLITEIMGKHSNIIFCDEQNVILDSIKHISANVSSLREVLPGKTWFIPDELKKNDPLAADKDSFFETVFSLHMPVYKALYMNYAGFSPAVSCMLLEEASVDADRNTDLLDEDEKERIYSCFLKIICNVKDRHFCVSVIYRSQVPDEFYAVSASGEQSNLSISAVVKDFYEKKNRANVMRTKSADLRKMVHNLMERNARKLSIQEKQLKDTEKRDTYKLYGELLTAYGYELSAGQKRVSVLNYYDQSTVDIPLDETLTPLENAKKYYGKYTKAKRMYEATIKQLEQTRQDLMHLDSIDTEITLAANETDLNAIKEEMIQAGYVKKHSTSSHDKKKTPKAGKPYHYVTEDGFDIYVGRSNIQNDELTFQFALGNDMWFHAKGIPGSHVLVKTAGRTLPDHVYEQAAQLAAYYSKGRDSEKVEVDYIEKKHVKKTPGGKPGFVIYHTNYSMMVKPQIGDVKEK